MTSEFKAKCLLAIEMLGVERATKLHDIFGSDRIKPSAFMKIIKDNKIIDTFNDTVSAAKSAKRNGVCKMTVYRKIEKSRKIKPKE